MAGYLIDTSVLIDVERGEGALGRVPADDEHVISMITVSELLHGVHRAVDAGIRMRRQALVEHILVELEAVPITIEVARIHAQLWARLQAAGESIGLHDLWIAATALVHGLQIATTNKKDFERIPGLSVLAL